MLEEIAVNYSSFILKLLTMIVLVLMGLGYAMKSKKQSDSGEVSVTNLREKFEEQQSKLEETVLSGEAYQELESQRQKEAKERQKSGPRDSESRLFVLNFDGDVKAEAVSALREEITALLPLIKQGDEVLLRLESPGGVVPGYGLAASQLQRLREQNVSLTVAVDKVAASGGYLMACVANKIVAAPFSLIGSIGVVAEVPNIHRLLKKHDIDVDVMTAGQYKRTVTLMGENTEVGKEKFQEEINETHKLFKEFVSKHRPQIDIETIATGEYWYGTRALELHLVDELSTSDDIILKALKEKDVFEIKYKEKKKLVKRLGEQAELSIEKIIMKLLNTPSNMM